MTNKPKPKPKTSKPAAKKPAPAKAENGRAATNGTKRKKKNWTMAELLKLPAEEVALMAWQASYEARLKEQNLD